MNKIVIQINVTPAQHSLPIMQVVLERAYQYIENYMMCSKPGIKNGMNYVLSDDSYNKYMFKIYHIKNKVIVEWI